jgi:ADP-heptose:LPS heptosyltransferase/GT2 family glycosyltransferase
MGYQIFLGRDPENSFVIADARSSPVGAFIRALMSSGEFQSAVLDRLAHGRPLPHESATVAPAPEQLDWLFGLLRVPARAETVLRSATSWAEWMRTLVAIPGFPSAPMRDTARPANSPDARAAGEGFVLINIDQPKPGDQIQPGGLLQGSGWVIAPEDIAEVAVQLDGALLTHARYGLPRPDVARSFPHYRHVDHCGFSFSADLPTEAPPGADPAQQGQLTVSVRTVGGQAGRKGVRLKLPGLAAASASSPAVSAEAAWPIRLAVEEAVVDSSRMLRLRGWAVSAESMQSITVWLGETRLGEARHGLSRPDIANAHPSYANAPEAGWALVRVLADETPAGPAFVRVQAADSAGHTRQTIVPVEIPRSESGGADSAIETVGSDTKIRCVCDQASLLTDGTMRVAGWAMADSGVAAIRVELDGISLGLAALGRKRDDLARRYPDVTDAGTAGFLFTHTLARKPRKGVHRLSLHVTATDGGQSVVEAPLVAEAGTAAPKTEAELPAMPNVPETMPPLHSAAVPGMRLEVDQPVLEGNAASEPVRGSLNISGWAAARTGIAQVSVYCDESLLGHAYYGMRREDIGAAYPEYKGSLLAGYALVLPPGTLPEGRHIIRVVATAAPPEAQDAPAGPALAGTTIETRFVITVERYDALPPDGAIRPRLPPAEAAFGLGLLARRDHAPCFEIVLAARPGEIVDIAALDETLKSLRAQAYPRWSAIMALPDAPSLKAARALEAANDADGRVQLSKAFRQTQDQPARKTPSKTLAATPAPRAASGRSRRQSVQPSFTMVLRPGDRLGADALLEMALAGLQDPAADFIYADELRHDPAQLRRQPFFKPDWSPNMLLGMNYVGRPWCARAELLQRAGLSPARLAASTDFDAVLRLTEAAQKVAHVARVLSERGDQQDSREDEQAALSGALERRSIAGAVEQGPVAGTWRVRREIGKAAGAKGARAAVRRPRGAVAGRISIIIPTCAARGLIRTAIKTIRATTAPALAGGQEVEIVVLDNTPVRDTRTRAWLRKAADIVIDMPGPFNWSRFNNTGARAATGEYLLFLNDDIEIRQPGWLEAMLEYAQRPEVGVVGARLIYPDGKVQHGGQYLADNHARHAFRFADSASPGPFGIAAVAREMMSVTGACQMIRARTFADLGGFEEAHSVVNNDLDFCLRCWRAGLSVLYTPHATLIHHELASRASLADSYDEARFAGAWRQHFLAGDPYRGPRLAIDSDHYGADPEPSTLLFAGRRGPKRDEVRRILAVKLDHIGDFLTALPALRSLAERFPRARIDLLAPAATAQLARGHDMIAETIVFDFFHARSGQGQKGVGEAEYRALAERLAPARYDIAIDLRMQPETRAMLQHTGAAFLAGYDHNNRFGFLDVALEWEGDSRLVLKRAHVSERLVQLVSAVEDACRDDVRPPAASRLDPAKVPALASLSATFRARPLVCVHPGVGNTVRQWPVQNYAALIEMLAGAGLHCVLIGALDEAPIAEDILRRLATQGVAESLVGRVKLAELSDVMRACVLFVGNNSGPQHLAGSLGMPAIGIHSGVVDATEWAPLGDQAVAIRKRMICGPCYLEFAADCPRSLACLSALRPRDVFAACMRLLA